MMCGCMVSIPITYLVLMTSNKEIGIRNLKLFIKTWVILLPMYQGRSFFFSEKKREKNLPFSEVSALDHVIASVQSSITGHKTLGEIKTRERENNHI